MTAPAVAMPAATAGAMPIPGQYIVTVKRGHNPAAVARGVAAKPIHLYTSALNGFAARLDSRQLARLRGDRVVQDIETDDVTHTATTQNMDGAGDPWGLDRIDGAALPLTKTYSYNSTGAGVFAFVLDTGLQADHSQFGGRAANSYNATSASATDCNGHGTHVAGTIGGSTYGVAKAVRLRAIKVMVNCSGTGTESDLIEGIDWLKLHAVKPGVANISIETPKSTAVNTATNNLVLAGVFVAAAAGNGTTDACTRSPASAAQSYTVAASTKTDSRRSSSNYGSCVDIYAPGDAIKSATIGGATAVLGGTSMAGPHVAGVAALRCTTPAFCTPSQLKSWLTTWGTPNVIVANKPATPNLLLNKRSL